MQTFDQYLVFVAERHCVQHACVMPLLFTFNLQTKFEMSSFIRSKDMACAQNVKVSHVTLTTPLSGMATSAGWDLLPLTYTPNLKFLTTRLAAWRSG